MFIGVRGKKRGTKKRCKTRKRLPSLNHQVRIGAAQSKVAAQGTSLEGVVVVCEARDVKDGCHGPHTKIRCGDLKGK